MASPNKAYHFGIQFNASSGYTELRGRLLETNISRKIADVFTPLGAGTMEAILDNSDGALSPDNSASPYYGAIRPGLACRVWGIYDGVNSSNVLSLNVSSYGVNSAPSGVTFYPLFTGTLDELSFALRDAGGARDVTMRFRDQGKKLLSERINMALNVDYNITSLFVDVLSTAGITSDVRSVQAIDDTAKYTYLDPDISALDAMSRIIESGDYYVYIDGRGILQVKDRNFTQGVSVVGSYNTGLDGNYSLNDDSVGNIVRISADPREPATSVQTVYWTAGPITLQPSSHISFFADYFDPVSLEPVPVSSPVTPVASQDYYATTNSLGTGTNRTTTTSVSVGFLGMTAVCTVFNGHSDTVYLNRFQLRGLPLLRRAPIVAEVKNSSSQAVFGDRPLTIVNNLIGTQAYAQAYGEYLLGLRGNPVPKINFAKRNEWPTVMRHELGDSLNITNLAAGIDNQFILVGLEHSLNGHDSFTHTVTWEIERSRDFELLFLDSATEGLLDSRRLGA